MKRNNPNQHRITGTTLCGGIAVFGNAYASVMVTAGVGVSDFSDK